MQKNHVPFLPLRAFVPSCLRASFRFSAFTLIELMTVITIIVLVLAAAVPVINLLEGNRSLASGYNRVSAALGHARQLALYYRAPAGVAFYIDPLTGRQDIAYVMQAKNIAYTLGTNQGSVVLNAYPGDADSLMDIIPDEELITLPFGVGVSVLTGGSALINTDGFLNFGLVLFDENGQLSNAPYAVAVHLLTNPPGYPNMLADYQHMNLNPLAPAPGLPGVGPTLYSHPAICIYDRTAYKNQVKPTAGTAFDDESIRYVNAFYLPYVPPNAPPTAGNIAPFAKQNDKIAEEQWLTANGQIYAIKPNDGSLLKNQ